MILILHKLKSLLSLQFINICSKIDDNFNILHILNNDINEQKFSFFKKVIIMISYD